MDLGAFNLSWELLLTVVSGYAGYFVSNVGARAHHRTIDVTFSTVVYGFFGILAYLTALGAEAPIWVATPLAFVGAMFAGGVWSAFLRRVFTGLLRLMGVSHSDDLPSALSSLFSVTNAEATQLSVKLNNGQWLICRDLSAFRTMPNGPCALGTGGDVLMYVTHTQVGDGDHEECAEVVHEKGGAEISYIPASQIARIDMRRRKTISFWVKVARRFRPDSSSV